MGWSLERRLPVLISLLLACVVGGLSLAAYREVRASAISRATDRLERSARELAVSAARATVERTEALRAFAADTVIVRAVLDRAAQSLVVARLASFRDARDSTLMGWQIADAAGAPRFASAGGWTSADSAMLAATLAGVARTDSALRSPLFAVDGRVHTWGAAPIRVGGRAVGSIAELRRLGDNSAADAAIGGLLEDEARMLFTSRGSNEWASIRGRAVPAPFVSPTAENRAVRVDMTGRPGYAVQQALPTSPWLLVVFQPEAAMLRRPHEFLRRILAAGVLVLALATIGAWLLGRHVTRPLRDVTDAAAALGQGDYSRRVSVIGGGSEIASLSSTFNAMADAISDAHATLAERNAELQRANAAKSQFLAMMSHELRTPLNAIGGYTDLLMLGVRGPVTPEQLEDLGRIRRNKELLLAIITDILEFTRADAGALVVEAEAVSIAHLVADATDAVAQQFAAKNVRLAVSSVPPGAVARGDRERLHQVLLNLLSNAMKFTEPGGEVVIGTAIVDEHVCIEVADTGRGISASELDAIFEPFVQIDASLTRRAGGTGLGLAIARQMTSAMGGTLTVRSTVGVGSTFTIALPIAQQQERALATAPVEPHDERQIA